MVKKGQFTLKQLAGLIIALLAIVFVFFPLFTGLFSLFVDSDEKNAKAFVDSLTAKIENLKDGESNTFALQGVENWTLVAWNKDISVGENEKPEKCFDKNCLCLCENIKNCQENGICRDLDSKISVNSIGFFDVYEEYFESRIDKESVTDGGKFSASCLVIDKGLNPINVIKESEEVKILLDYGDVSNAKYLSLIGSFKQQCEGQWKPSFLLN